jgi:uncharacterized protein (TIGR00369 family)
MADRRFEPRAADWEQRGRASFAKQGLMALYGAEIVALAPGACEIACRYRAELGQQHGFFHGGVSGALADTACGFAALSLFEAGAGVLTVEFKLNFLAPAEGERLIVRGRVERAGRQIVVCRGDVAVAKDGVEKPVATGLFTMMKVATVTG